jgi:hypothetical protein
VHTHNQVPGAVIPLSPLGLTKKEAAARIGCGPRFMQRMIHASRATGDKWLDFSCNAKGRPRLEVRVTAESAQRAFERMCKGEEPPLLPCEVERLSAPRQSKPRKSKRPKVQRRQFQVLSLAA